MNKYISVHCILSKETQNTDLSSTHQWKQGSTKNLAEDASSGMTADAFFKPMRWIKGPETLWNGVDLWPLMPKDLSPISPDDPEVKKEFVVIHDAVMEER